MFAALLLQLSLFASPLYRDENPPESRSARALLVAWERSGEDKGVAARAAAEQLAQALCAELRAGTGFEEICSRLRARSIDSGGGVLGTFFPGTLAPPIDEFLFHASEFEVSPPIESDSGFQIVQRIDRLAGCRAILLAGKDAAARDQASELLKRVRDGADFAELARAHSKDKETAARGGALGIFERGPSDRLLKAAVFELKVGQCAGPIESPLGLHLIQRVEPSTLDAGLADVTVVRLRLILIAFRGARGANPGTSRDHARAEALARELVVRIRAGADMAELAASHDDDPGGRERRGDLGWIRRRSTQIPDVLDRVFTMRVGEIEDPVATDRGFVVLRRER